VTCMNISYQSIMVSLCPITICDLALQEKDRFSTTAKNKAYSLKVAYFWR
jgi:hypothetical protein